MTHEGENNSIVHCLSLRMQCGVWCMMADQRGVYLSPYASNALNHFEPWDEVHVHSIERDSCIAMATADAEQVTCPTCLHMMAQATTRALGSPA